MSNAHSIYQQVIQLETQFPFHSPAYILPSSMIYYYTYIASSTSNAKARCVCCDTLQGKTFKKSTRKCNEPKRKKTAACWHSERGCGKGREGEWGWKSGQSASGKRWKMLWQGRCVDALPCNYNEIRVQRVWQRGKYCNCNAAAATATAGNTVAATIAMATSAISIVATWGKFCCCVFCSFFATRSVFSCVQLCLLLLPLPTPLPMPLPPVVLSFACALCNYN